MSSGLDYIGTKLIAIRRTTTGVRITVALDLTDEELVDLAKLVMAAKTVADWEN